MKIVQPIPISAAEIFETNVVWKERIMTWPFQNQCCRRCCWREFPPSSWAHFFTGLTHKQHLLHSSYSPAVTLTHLKLVFLLVFVLTHKTTPLCIIRRRDQTLKASLAPSEISSTAPWPEPPRPAMSVSAAASLLQFSDWSQYSSAALAKKLEGPEIAPTSRPGKPRRQAQLNLKEMGRARIPKSHDFSSTVVAAEDLLLELYGLSRFSARPPSGYS